MTTAKLFPLWDHGSPASAPFGLSMCQNRIAIPTWSFAMERVPPKRIIELGTYSGGFITALAVHAAQIGARVITYDRAKPDERLEKLARFLGVEFRTCDLYAAATELEIAALIALPGTSYVLCDGGDKPRELSTYAAYCKPGDVIAAHDYVTELGPVGDDVYWPCSEITAADCADAAAKHKLEPFHQEHFDLAAWIAFRKAAP